MARTSRWTQVAFAAALAGGMFLARTPSGVQAAGQSAAGELRTRIDRLEAGVRAQEGVRAVKRLQHSYGHYLDSGLWSEAADLFTDDAVGQFQGTTVRGKDGLRRHFMSEAGRTAPGLAPGQLNAYLVLQPIVTMGADGKTAKATWHELAMLGQFEKSASWRGGVYENEYALDKGVWKISKLQYYLQYSGAYQEYGHKAPPKWEIPYHFEAAHVGVTIPQSALQGPSAAPADASPASRVAQLRLRAERLHDETSVENLQHSYGYYLDRKLWDDVADLFADDGTLEIAGHGVYVGKARIRRALEALYGPSPLRTGELFDHINLATVVTVAADGRTAAARTSQLGQIGLNGSYARWELGTLENEFVRSNDNIWRVKSVHYYPRLATDYDKGWGADAKAFPAPAKDQQPDRQAQAFDSYPKPFTVSFHYANPVTGKAVQYPMGPQTRVQTVKYSAGSSLPMPAASNQTLDPLVTQVERQLAMAIGVDATENLMSSYGYYIDESAWDQMADTYSLTRGAKEITGAGTYVGQERIRKVLNLRGPAGGRTANFFTIHQLTQPVIHVAEDAMSAKARLRLFQDGGNADGSSGSWIGGIYENTAVFENGEWKFGVQDLHHIFNASYRNGWARVGAAGRGAAPAGGPRAGVPPGGPANAATPTGGQPTTPPAGAAGGQRAAAPPAPAGAAGARGAAGRDVAGGGITQGLGGAAQPSRFIKEFPPDRPIRARQYAFPEIVEPAFHYRNPVSGRMPAELLP